MGSNIGCGGDDGGGCHDSRWNYMSRTASVRLIFVCKYN